MQVEVPLCLSPFEHSAPHAVQGASLLAGFGTAAPDIYRGSQWGTGTMGHHGDRHQKKKSLLIESKIVASSPHVPVPKR